MAENNPLLVAAGIGRALLAAFCIEAECRGLHKLVGRMFAVNAGRLNGEWRDTVPVERLLGAARRVG